MALKPQQFVMDGFVTDARAAFAVAALERKQRKRGASKEDLFDFQCRAMKLPPFTRQAMFAKEIGRRWMFDFCWTRPYMLAVEIEGLVVQRMGGELVVRGRHASISGFKEDCLKYASAAVLGWTVIRFEQSQVKSGEAIDYTMRVLAARGWRGSELREGDKS